LRIVEMPDKDVNGDQDVEADEDDSSQVGDIEPVGSSKGKGKSKIWTAEEMRQCDNIIKIWSAVYNDHHRHDLATGRLIGVCSRGVSNEYPIEVER
jgi:hypothetical protein